MIKGTGRLPSLNERSGYGWLNRNLFKKHASLTEKLTVNLKYTTSKRDFEYTSNCGNFLFLRKEIVK